MAYEKEHVRQRHSVWNDQKYFIGSLIGIFFIWLIPYLFEKNITVFISDMVYFPLSIFLIMVTGYRVIQSYFTKDPIIPWIVLLGSTISMMMAEHIWSINELILGTKTFPSFADVAFLTSYVLLIIFFFILVNPLKNSISKKTKILALCISSIIIISTGYTLIQTEQGTYTIENTLLSAYPILDGIALFPASIGMILFLKGKINFGPSLMFFAMIPQLVADILYQITVNNETYYTGSQSELFFYLFFVIFMFGVYSSHKLVKHHDTGVTNI